MKISVDPDAYNPYVPKHDVSAVPPLGGYAARRCPVRTQLRCNPPADAVMAEPGPMLQFRFDAGNAFERRLLDAIAAEVQPVEEVIAATKAAMETGASFIVGGELPVDSDGRRTGRPDLLVRAGAVLSPSGKPAYWPVDVKMHTVLGTGRGEPATVSPLEAPFVESASLVIGRSDENTESRRADLLQLAHYWRMLQACGHAADVAGGPVWGGVAGTDIPGVVWGDLTLARFRSNGVIYRHEVESALQRYDFEFAFRLDIAATAIRHRDDPSVWPLVDPMACAECANCEWRNVCAVTLTADSGDVSLLPRVGHKQWATLRSLGFRTRADVAALHPRTARLVDSFPGRGLTAVVASARRHSPLTKMTAALPGNATKQLRAFADNGFTRVVDLDEIDGRTAELSGRVSNLADLVDIAWIAVHGGNRPHRRRNVETTAVPRADVEVDIDMENAFDGATYLWGMHVTNRSGKPFGCTDGYIPFVAWSPMTPVLEVDLFVRFWDRVEALFAEATSRNLTCKVYVWHETAEISKMRRAVALAGALGADLRTAIEGLQRSERWVDLEKEFQRVALAPSGSGLKKVAPHAGYEWEADDAGGEASMLWHHLAVDGDEVIRAKLLRYNENDVAAGVAIRDWLCTHELPTLPE